MSEQVTNAHLPHVESIDLSTILTEDILDKSHAERWLRFAHQNPKLAQEILRRALVLSELSESKLDTYKGAIDLVTYAVDALEAALERLSATDDDGAAANQPPLAAPCGDLPADEPFPARFG